MINPAQRKAIAEQDKKQPTEQPMTSMLNPTSPVQKAKPIPPATFNAQPRKDRLFKL
jgi:hypothetical protein